jgi:hypothetical protein
MESNQDKRMFWSVGLTAAFAVLSALVLSFVSADEAGARWAWCLGDPKYSLTTEGGETGEIWVDLYFPVDELENVNAIDVTIRIPRNIAATVDPESLAVFVDGKPVDGITVTGAVAHSDETWSNGPVKVDVAGIVHGSGDFPVKMKVSRSNGSNMSESWSNGDVNELITKSSVPVKVQ